jgi:hypothetical protein
MAGPNLGRAASPTLTRRRLSAALGAAAYESARIADET